MVDSFIYIVIRQLISYSLPSDSLLSTLLRLNRYYSVFVLNFVKSCLDLIRRLKIDFNRLFKSDIVSVLLKHEANSLLTDKDGYSALHLAIESENLAAIKSLLHDMKSKLTVSGKFSSNLIN